MLPTALFLGFVSAIVSVLFGWLLAEQGGYEPTMLNQHKWLGIGLAIVSLAAWLWSVKTADRVEEKKTYRITGIFMALILVLVSLTGHLGGSLTHGEDYLTEYAPPFVQSVFGNTTASNLTNLPFDSDSILIYTHLIKPVLEEKCITCHNNGKRKGGLNMAHLDSLLSGGENGEVLIEGSPYQSELFRRVSMDRADKKFMPPTGESLSYTEVQLLKTWIRNDLDTTLTVTSPLLTEEEKGLIEQYYNISTRQKLYVEKVKVPPIPEESLADLRSKGFTIRILAEGSNFLDVSSLDSISVTDVESLQLVKEQLTWLDLSGTGLTDDHMVNFNELKNLTRLDLHNNVITDKGITSISTLPHLESLNLHSTNISDEGLKSLEQLISLKTLYLWNTKVTEAGLDALRKKLPKLEVNTGLKLLIVQKEKEKEANSR
jgi:hypothetical protein